MEIRRTTMEWILFGVLGFLALVVFGFVGNEMLEHEKRLNALERQSERTVTLCETIQVNLTTINGRLQRIEGMMMDGRGRVSSPPNSNNGGL